ncbi:hypothetical protein IRJ14_14515, partial [Isoptericola sp. QY 916]|nr:hypothetical protein [Isoptericola sp. QY 916]
MTARPPTLTSRLLHAGFADLTRSASLWSDPALQEALAEPGRADALLAAVGTCADPDLALLQLVRLAEHPDARERLGALLDEGAPPRARTRLLAVLGASSALGDEVVRRPELLDVLAVPDGAALDTDDIDIDIDIDGDGDGDGDGEGEDGGDP